LASLRWKGDSDKRKAGGKCSGNGKATRACACVDLFLCWGIFFGLLSFAFFLRLFFGQSKNKFEFVFCREICKKIFMLRLFPCPLWFLGSSATFQRPRVGKGDSGRTTTQGGQGGSCTDWLAEAL
jgi:hypothetical protein